MELYSIKRKISSLKPTNRNPLYRSHLYWSQKPYNICDILIEDLTEVGDVVFDPFMGSGVTVIESVLHNRKGIGVEINDLPIFIVETLLQEEGNTDVINKLCIDFESFLNKFYYVYKTKSCNESQTGIIKKVIFDRNSPFDEPVIKEIHYKVDNFNETYIKKPDIFDTKQMQDYSDFQYINVDFKMIPNSRLAVYQNQSVTTLFTPRTLFIIDKILEYNSSLKDKKLQNIIKYILMSSLHIIKITDVKSNSQWPLWTPKHNCLEKNAIDVIKKRIKLFQKSIQYLSNYPERNLNKNKNFKDLQNNGGYYIIKKGTQNLTVDDIPDESIDLVITDPPYLGQVLYSEYMQLYYPFLNFEFNFEDEIVVSNAEGRNKSEANYFNLLDLSFSKISKKLKKGKLLCMYFHDSNLSVWNNLINIMKKNGLYFLSQVHIYKKMTLKNILSPKKSLQGDSLLFFIKEEKNYKFNPNESLEEIIENIILHIQTEILQNDGLTTTQLMDNGLMEYIIQNGWLDPLSKNYKTIIDIIQPYVEWDSQNGKWIPKKE